ncbi:class I SAM-dependent methyltransferase [Methanoregula sp.]|jgi:ubiquinone/menaquinone biosynthesis C-methylase UbiE|uniref:class I SAM-dependent methyltransferase n=1 Tax=Methanoregula sp. TaxID=2052170 RepID=UPI003567D811
MSGSHEVFPVSRAGYLDGWWRRFKYQPGRLVDRYVRPGDTVLDIGCGPGLFTLPIARRVGENGQVIAVDLQEGMLAILKEKATREGLGARIRLHKAGPHSLALEYPGRIDVAFGLCVIHEVSDPARLVQEVYSLLAPGGTFLIAEPKHEVSRDEFETDLSMAASAGFRRVGTPFVLRSRTALFRKDGAGYPR